MSLSRRMREKKLQEQKLREHNIKVDDLRPPVLERTQSSIGDSQIEALEIQLKNLIADANPVIAENEPEPEVKRKERYLFISDGKSPLIKQFGLTEFSNSMRNRTLEDVGSHVDNLWVSITNKNGRHWLEANLKRNSVYTTILVYEKNKYNKFLSDLKPYVDIITKKKHINRVSALDISELVNNLSSRVDIHSPANCLAVLLGCSKKIMKDKRSKN